MLAIEVETLAAAAAWHCPVLGTVWQIASAIGRLAEPVPGVAVIVPPAPRLTVATAKAAAPEAPGMSTIPSPVGVAASGAKTPLMRKGEWV